MKKVLMMAVWRFRLPAIAADNTIKGKLDIQFNSRVQVDSAGNPTAGREGRLHVRRDGGRYARLPGDDSGVADRSDLPAGIGAAAGGLDLQPESAGRQPREPVAEEGRGQARG